MREYRRRTVVGALVLMSVLASLAVPTFVPAFVFVNHHSLQIDNVVGYTNMTVRIYNQNETITTYECTVPIVKYVPSNPIIAPDMSHPVFLNVENSTLCHRVSS